MFSRYFTPLAGFVIGLVVALTISLLTLAGAKADGFERNSVHGMVTWSALKHGVPPALAHGVVRVESGYKCGARNPSSTAKGIMQVLDGTARGVGIHGNRLDCRTGLEAGMRYLRQAYLRARGNLCATATLYNRGVGGRPSCSGYGRKVLSQAGL